jgi:Rrf2 family protein
MSSRRRRGSLAIAAVVDIALNAKDRPVAAKSLAIRHGLPARHLEPVLQALVHQGILKGTRGPRGGYELGRDQDRITADDILRAAQRLDAVEEATAYASPVVGEIVGQALAKAERAFSTELRTVTIADLRRAAEALMPPADPAHARRGAARRDATASNGRSQIELRPARLPAGD